MKITIFSVELVLTSTYSQCTTTGVGSYGGTEITKFPAELILASAYH